MFDRDGGKVQQINVVPITCVARKSSDVAGREFICLHGDLADSANLIRIVQALQPDDLVMQIKRWKEDPRALGRVAFAA